MAIVDVFLLKFATEGMGDVKSDVKNLEKELNKLGAAEEDLADETKNVSDEMQGAKKKIDDVDKTMQKAKNTTSSLDKAMGKTFGAAGLNGFLTQTLKTLSPYILAFNAVRNTFGQISKLSEGLEKYNDELKLSNKYKVFTHEDAMNAKEYEMIMRDVRMGMGAISANLTKAFLPALKQIAIVARNVTDFLLEHTPAIRIALAVVGITLLPSIFRGLGKIFGLISGKAILLTGLILLLDDLYAWMNGGESAFGDFWNKLFGSPKQLLDTLKAIPTWLKTIGIGLAALAIINPWQTLLFGAKGALLGLKGIWSILKLFPNMLSLITTAVRSLTAFMVANPILAAITAVLAVLVLVWKNWDKITTAVKKATEAVKSFFMAKGKSKDVPINGSHAGGLDYVPYDGYIAELHKGERIQTADEAQDWRAGLIAAKKAINFTASYPLNSIPSGAVSNAFSNNNTSNKSVTFSGDIIINTQANDGEGVVSAFRNYIKQAVISLDDGMLA